MKAYLFFFLLSLSFLFASAEEGEKVTIVVARIPRKDVISVRFLAARAAFEEFIRTHPHINVIPASQLHVSGSRRESTELMAMAGGIAPDVLYLFGRKIGNYRDQGFIYPLNEYLEKYYQQEKKFYRGIEAPAKVWELCVHEGKVWAVPNWYYTMGLIYRKDLFEAAGLPTHRGPESWDEFYRWCRKLTYPRAKLKRKVKSRYRGTQKATTAYGKQMERTRGQFGFALAMAGGAGWRFMNFVWSAGGEVVRPYKECPQCHFLTPHDPSPVDYQQYYLEIKFPPKKKSQGTESCQKCGYSLAQVKNIEWRLVINEPPGVEALKFYQKLRWQKWMRCRNDHPDREFDLTPQMFKRNLAICPHCRAKYNLTELEKQKEIYTGVVRLFGTYQEDTQAFVRGEVAMLINYGFRQLISLIDGYGLSPEQIGMASFPPKDKNTPRANFIAGHYYAINGSIKDKKRRDAAWEYIKFMTGEVARRIRVKTYVEAGWAKFVRPEELKKFGYEDYYREIPPDWIAASTEIEQSAKIEPYNPGFQNVMTTEMGVPIDKILTYENTNPQEVLDECCRRVNTLIMGKEPPARRRKKIMVGRMIFALLLAGLAFLILKFASLLKGKVGEEKPTGPLAIFSTSKLRRHLVAWLFLLAAFLSILVWQYIPLVRGTIIAFLDYRILGGSKFVGLHNFIEVFFQPLFYQVLLNTTLYVGLTVLLGFIAPIVLALFLSEIPYGKVFFRVVFYLPTMVTSLIVIFLWKNLVYAPEGLLNQLLNFFRLPSQQWIRDPNWAMFCIVLARIWGVTGAGSLIYLAALKNVPEEMYEAAEIDGAGIIYKIFHITLPFLRPLIIINFVGVVVTAFQAMQNIFIMTGGGPINATRVIGIDIWYNAFLFLKFGYATAEAWILGSFLIMFTFYQLKILKKVEFKTAQ